MPYASADPNLRHAYAFKGKLCEYPPYRLENKFSAYRKEISLVNTLGTISMLSFDDYNEWLKPCPECGVRLWILEDYMTFSSGFPKALKEHCERLNQS